MFRRSLAGVLTQLLLIASVLVIPTVAAAAPVVSNTVTSTIVYDDILDGEVSVQLESSSLFPMP